MPLEQILEQFHFLRPWWLTALLPVAIITWLLWRRAHRANGWQSVIAPHLAQVLVVSQQQTQRSALRWSLPLALVALVLAGAGPSWERIPQPVYQLNAGQVVVLDMSLSMRATDVPPNRLTQMQYKAMQLTDEHLDGETGLIAYAGDAYVISPLTADASSLGNLIRALRPEIMPELGSYPLSALQLADRLLREAGYAEGDIYWFTDGIDTRDQQELTSFVRNHPHRLAVLAVGTEQGAPIELEDGKLLRDQGGDVVIPKMTPARLERLAQLSNGRFAELRQDQQDIIYLSGLPPLSRDGKDRDDQQGDTWYDLGPWLVLFALLAMLPLARRGVLFTALFSVICASQLVLVPPAAAQSSSEGLSWDEQLWQTPYQHADEALRNENYERAARIAEDPWQRGAANYRNGNYEQAVVDFSQVDNPAGFYNQGNSLMQLERFDEAANAYREALERDPDFAKARDNLALAEQAAEEQQRQQQQQQGEGQGQQQQPQQQESADGEQNDASPSGSEQAPQQQEPEQASEGEPQPPAEPQAGDADPEAEAQEGEPLPGQEGEADPLSEEQRQQMEQWLNRIEDDPAYLLQRKMLEEARKRRTQQRQPQGVQKQW
ncbi:VWA domain-containing protein [Pseudidiomarina terrestris]|uniref:VWA domain-containing protein n=1 Tax=Pseudidiomarina terrestris TaxID=2820060 RepID=UPI0026558225|nr:VWA domain-containing protein [Pseudidiomarina sp. 1ASP75-5]MDN7134753.1 VWA domain-containing protein [Pseudidiomarina sp. 1ASP75-5]